MIVWVTSSKMSRYGIMAIQLLATLTTDHHLLKCGIVVYLVNLRHLFHSIPLEVCFVSQLDRCCYVSFCELILSCSTFEKIDPSRVSFPSRCHVGRSSSSKTSRRWWWSNQRSFEVHPRSWRLCSFAFPLHLTLRLNLGARFLYSGGELSHS